MALEPSFDYISDLDPNNPAPNDPVSEGDDHLRGIKNALQGNVNGDENETRLLVDGVGTVFARADQLTVLGLRGTMQSAAPSNTRWELSNVDFGGSLTLRTTGELRLETRNGGLTTPQTAVSCIRDGATQLYHAGVLKLATASDGVEVSDISLDQFVGTNNTLYHRLRNSIGGARFTLLSTSGDWQQNQLASDGTFEKTWISGRRDGGVELSHDGTVRFQTEASGFTAEGTTYDIGQGTDNSILWRQVNAIGGLRTIVASGSGETSLQQLSAAGAFEANWIKMQRGGAVLLYNAGTQRLTTNSVGVEVAGNAAVTSGAPAQDADLTRRDYVEDWAKGNNADRTLRVSSTRGTQDQMLQNGVTTAAGQAISVTFPVPFNQVPNVSMTMLIANTNNAAWYLTSITATGFTGISGTSGAQFSWLAAGRAAH